MNAKEFAELYASRTFSTKFYPYGSGKNPEEAIGHIVGHGHSELLVEFLDPIIRKRSWSYDERGGDEVDQGITFVVCREDFYYPEDRRLWSLTTQYVTLLDDKPAKKIKLPLPYPDVCSKCSSPARCFGALTVCSNDGCKTRQEVIKSLKIDYESLKRHVLKCAWVLNRNGENMKCGHDVIGFKLHGYREDSYTLTCTNGHSVAIAKRHLNKGDVILTAGRQYLTNRIWNGRKWESL